MPAALRPEARALEEVLESAIDVVCARRILGRTAVVERTTRAGQQQIAIADHHVDVISAGQLHSCVVLQQHLEHLGRRIQSLVVDDHMRKPSKEHIESGRDRIAARMEAMTGEVHLGRPAQEEMGVDRDAVPTHAEPRLVDVAVRLRVGRTDDFLDVHAHPVGVPGELVGKGDVHVAVRGVGQLRKFGRLGAGERDDVRIEHRGVEGRRSIGRRRPDAADKLRIHGQVAEHCTRIEPLG